MSKTTKILAALPFVCAISAFAVFGFAPTASLAATVDVTPTSMGTWAFVNRDGNTGYVTTPTTGSMVTGPTATPPLGTGSANLTTPGGTGDNSSALRSTGYSGLALTSITALSYSAYMAYNSPNDQQFPYLGLVVSTDGGVSVADTIFFEPPFQTHTSGNPNLPDQGATVLNTWKTWNALEGGWWDNNGISNPGNNGNDPTYSMSFGDLVAAIALAAGVNNDQVTIINPDDGQNIGNILGGIRFDVGFASPGDTFNGYVDNFTINDTTYNFDPASATPLPAALPLFASGLGALGLLGWRKKRKSAAKLAA